MPLAPSINCGCEGDPDFPVALRCRQKHEGALAEAEGALAMMPNLADAHGVRGAALIFSGRPEEGLPAVPTCIRLDPRAPELAVRLNWVTLGLYFSRKYEAPLGRRNGGSDHTPISPRRAARIAAPARSPRAG
jgi:hypothetical protein